MDRPERPAMMLHELPWYMEILGAVAAVATPVSFVGYLKEAMKNGKEQAAAAEPKAEEPPVTVTPDYADLALARTRQHLDA